MTPLPYNTRRGKSRRSRPSSSTAPTFSGELRRVPSVGPESLIGEHKYRVITPCSEMDFDSGKDYIINRARLYPDRRDFAVE